MILIHKSQKIVIQQTLILRNNFLFTSIVIDQRFFRVLLLLAKKLPELVISKVRKEAEGAVGQVLLNSIIRVREGSLREFIITA